MSFYNIILLNVMNIEYSCIKISCMFFVIISKTIQLYHNKVKVKIFNNRFIVNVESVNNQIYYYMSVHFTGSVVSLPQDSVCTTSRRN